MKWIAALAALAALAGCGGGSKEAPPTSGPGIPSTVALSPTTSSVNRGRTVTFSAAVLDVNNSAVAGQTITFQSSNTSVVSIANSGLACAGTWDSLTTPVVCTPGPAGTATITAVSGSLSSSPSTVYVHDPVDRITVSPSNPSCVSSGSTLQFSARAFSNGVDITSQVGPFSWGSTRQEVAVIDTSGLASAQMPGVGGINAGVGTAVSDPATFTTCAIVSLNLKTDTGAKSFAVDANASQNLAIDVVDSSGASVPGASRFLTFSTGQPVVGAATGSTLTFLGSVAGTTPIVASCTPPTCNLGLGPVYSNVVLASVNGSTTTTVYAAGTDGTSLVPIDTSTNAAGTSITLPAKPNSLMITPTGIRALLGSDTGMMIVDLATGNVTNAAAAPGRVVGVTPDGTRAVVLNVVTGALALIDLASGAVESTTAFGALRTAFSPDVFRAYMTGGNALHTWTQVSGFRSETLGVAGNDVAFLASGAAGFVAGGSAGRVLVRRTCDNSQVASIPVPATPARIAPLPDGSAMLAVDNRGVNVIPVTVTPASSPCGVGVSAASTFKDFGTGVFAPTGVVVAPNGSKAFVLANLPSVLVYNAADGTTSSIPLAGGATVTSGGITLDSKQLYVGGSDNKIHRIDVATGADAQQIDLTFKPDLVAVRPH